MIAGQESPNWGIAGIGIVFIFTSVLIESSRNSDYQKAAENFNANIHALNPEIVEYIANKNRYNSYQFDFKLKDGRSVYGKLLSKKDDELIIKQGKIIYIIHFDKISGIYQNKEDVTDSILHTAPQEQVDFFNYDVIEID